MRTHGELVPVVTAALAQLGPVRATDLADWTGQSVAALSPVLKDLEKQGRASRDGEFWSARQTVAAPADARPDTVSRTPAPPEEAESVSPKVEPREEGAGHASPARGRRKGTSPALARSRDAAIEDRAPPAALSPGEARPDGASIVEVRLWTVTVEVPTGTAQRMVVAADIEEAARLAKAALGLPVRAVAFVGTALSK